MVGASVFQAEAACMHRDQRGPKSATHSWPALRLYVCAEEILKDVAESKSWIRLKMA